MPKVVILTPEECTSLSRMMEIFAKQKRDQLVSLKLKFGKDVYKEKVKEIEDSIKFFENMKAKFE